MDTSVMNKRLSELCRQCDYEPLTQFLRENKKALSQGTESSASELDQGAAYARTRFDDFGASPSIITTQWDKFFWNCHCCKLLQVRKVVAELEAEIEAKEEDNPLFYWGVSMITAAAKKASQARANPEPQQ